MIIAIVLGVVAVLVIIKASQRSIGHIIGVAIGLAILLYMLKSHPRGWSILAALERLVGQVRYELFQNWPGQEPITSVGTESGYNLAAIKLELQRRIPVMARLYQLQGDVAKSLSRFYAEAGSRSEFTRGIAIKTDYYFNKSYVEIWAVLGGSASIGSGADSGYGEVLPQHLMVNLLNTQRKLASKLEDTIYVDSKHSDTDPEIQKLIGDIKGVYGIVNKFLADWVNKKTADKVNIYSGYLDYPDEPKPMNIYGDSYYHRVNKFY